MTISRINLHWFPLMSMIAGVYIILAAFDVFSFDLFHIPAGVRKSTIFNNSQYWPIANIGIMFFFGGFSITFARQGRWLTVLLNTIIFFVLLSPLVWLVYFSGLTSLPLRFVASIAIVIVMLAIFFELTGTNKKIYCARSKNKKH